MRPVFASSRGDHERTVGRSAAGPNGQVNAVLEQVDHPILEPHLDAQTRILIEQLRYERGDLAEAQRRRNAEYHPACDAATRANRALRLLDPREYGARACDEVSTGVGQVEPACGAPHESNAHLFLEPAKMPARHRHRESERARRPRDVSRVGDADEGGHLLQHGVRIEQPCMICKSASRTPRLLEPA
jgi:hypothetical protein